MDGGISTLALAGMAAMSSATSVAGQAKQSSIASAQQKVQQSRNAMVLAEQERDRESELQKTLAKQNAWFAAEGTSQGSGSALSLAQSAKMQTEKQNASANAYASLGELSSNLTGQSQRASSMTATTTGLLGAASRNVSSIGKMFGG